jgi:hypothetical protein
MRHGCPASQHNCRTSLKTGLGDLFYFINFHFVGLKLFWELDLVIGLALRTQLKVA